MLRDDLRREPPSPAGCESFPVQLLGDRDVGLSCARQNADSLHEASFPFRAGDRADRDLDRSLTDKAATPHDPDPKDTASIADQIDSGHQRAEHRLSSLDRESLPQLWQAAARVGEGVAQFCGDRHGLWTVVPQLGQSGLGLLQFRQGVFPPSLQRVRRKAGDEYDDSHPPLE
jgi:hypothetical protein